MTVSATEVPGAGFAIWLYKVRTSRGLSQEGLALRAGIAVPTYGRLERTGQGQGGTHVTLDTFLRVIEALELTSQELWTLVAMLKAHDEPAGKARAFTEPVFG